MNLPTNVLFCSPVLSPTRTRVLRRLPSTSCSLSMHLTPKLCSQLLEPQGRVSSQGGHARLRPPHPRCRHTSRLPCLGVHTVHARPDSSSSSRCPSTLSSLSLSMTAPRMRMSLTLTCRHLCAVVPSPWSRSLYGPCQCAVPCTSQGYI